MSEEELQMRRERHDAEMENIRAEIVKMQADVALARREAQFPATMMGALVLALVGPWLLSLVN